MTEIVKLIFFFIGLVILIAGMCVAVATPYWVIGYTLYTGFRFGWATIPTEQFVMGLGFGSFVFGIVLITLAITELFSRGSATNLSSKIVGKN